MTLCAASLARILRTPLLVSGLGVLMVVAASAAVTGQAAPPLSLEDYYRLEDAAGPAISPDGRWVAYERTYVLEEKNRRVTEIWLASTDGSVPPRRLTHPAFSSSDPQWSPDGRLLAFTSRRERLGGSPSSPTWFLRMDAPGGEAFQIDGVDDVPIFSPDNQWIAFTKEVPAAERPAGTPSSDFERRIEERFTGHVYDWLDYRFDRRGYLPDPRDPAASPPEELFIVPREGGDPRQLTTLGVDVQHAAWRPDSRALVIEADARQRDEYTYERADVWVVTLDGELRRLTDDGFNHSQPAWSPDGREVVFRRRASLNMIIEAKQNHGSPVDVYRMPATGGEMVNLTADWDLIPGPPAWSPDGRVYFEAGVRGSAHLFRVPASGGAVEPVTSGDRRLDDFTMTRAWDRMAYTATDSTHPDEVFVAALDGSGERRLSRVNDALFEARAVSRAEPIRYPSQDGTEIEGWVLMPPDYDPARGPYPLILAIHGGPHGAYGHTFSLQFQLWAAAGYIVVYTNPRGSTGYGESFLWGTWGGWGIRDSEDVLAGVDHVVERYPIDQSRIGVTGYSYGGFLTNWLITQTTRFKAAIVGAGISNWVSDYGTADIPRTKETEFYGPPWDLKAGALLRRLSPITHVAGARTPTLFVHGESDFRVPIEQGEQMYIALRKQRVPARFIRYPEMSHGGWTPWNLVHRYHQELAWWREHLGGGRGTR